MQIAWGLSTEQFVAAACTEGRTGAFKTNIFIKTVTNRLRNLSCQLLSPLQHIRTTGPAEMAGVPTTELVTKHLVPYRGGCPPCTLLW